MRIIPAIDILGGKCVRLTKGDYESQKIYNHNPVEVARELEDNGMRYLHLVDLDGARSGKVINYRILEKICSATGLVVDFGGGIRSDNDIDAAFGSGAVQVTGGSVAVNDPEIFCSWLKKYGPGKIILGADSRKGKITTGGWMNDSDNNIIRFISEYVTKGVTYAICTDVDRDGMLGGPATDLYREILESTSLNLIASGGISSIEDIEKVIEAGCEGVIIGKAIYEGRIKLKELRDLC
jgi:phosphoribosylformimino-5-aminoimidazole carboxamide ribotide isomerase